MFSLTACLAFLENEKDEEAFLRYYERYHYSGSVVKTKI